MTLPENRTSGPKSRTKPITKRLMGLYGLDRQRRFAYRFYPEGEFNSMLDLGEVVFLHGTGEWAPVETTDHLIDFNAMKAKDRPKGYNAKLRALEAMLDRNEDIIRALSDCSKIEGKAKYSVRYSGIKWLIQDLYRATDTKYYKQHLKRCRDNISRLCRYELPVGKNEKWPLEASILFLGHVICSLSVRGKKKNFLCRPWLPYVGQIAMVKYHPILIDGIIDAPTREINKSLYYPPYSYFPESWAEEDDPEVRYA